MAHQRTMSQSKWISWTPPWLSLPEPSGPPSTCPNFIHHKQSLSVQLHPSYSWWIFSAPNSPMSGTVVKGMFCCFVWLRLRLYRLIWDQSSRPNNRSPSSLSSPLTDDNKTIFISPREPTRCLLETFCPWSSASVLLSRYSETTLNTSPIWWDKDSTAHV